MATSGLDFQPQIHWGLDPVYNSYAKLYIKDLLEMPEYPNHQGTFAYKNHPIWKVDVVGLVVRVMERASLFHYGLDDGTGVIDCCCWKPKEESVQDELEAHLRGGGSRTESTSFLKELEDAARESQVKQLQAYQLGDLVHVRGRLKVFRGKREISASYYAKIEDPTCSVEIARMCELPKIYKFIYDKPFTLPAKLAEEIDAIKEEQITGVKTETRIVQELVVKVQEMLRNKNINNFELQDLQTVSELMAVAQQPCKEYLQDGQPSTDRVSAKQIRCIFKKVVNTLEENGVVFRKDTPGLVFEVIEDAETLEKTVLSILRRDSKTPKYEEKGCHYMHVIDCLHNTEMYRKVNSGVVLQVLEKLESQSDIVSTTRRHYITF
ncbi:CST complex subunit STN1-like [Glandiceps talaboti]